MNDDTPSRLRCGITVARRRAQGGFTIVETMIVLAVSGVLLTSSVLLVSGQQRKVEFTQAAQDVRSAIDQTITEVSSGYYPNPGNIKCSVSGSSISITAATGTGQGSNTGCIFLGKAIQFGVAGTEPQQYVTHTIAGLQDNAGTLASAGPKAVDIAGARETRELRNGLRAVSMKYSTGSIQTDIGAVAFVSGLGDHDASNQLVSGTQQVSMVPVKGSGTVPNTDIAATVGAINTQLATSPVNPASGVLICFAGAANQSALVTIGSNGRTLAVKLDFKTSGDCS